MIGHVAVCSLLFAIGLLLPLRGSAQAVKIYGVDSDARRCFDSARRAAAFSGLTDPPYSSRIVVPAEFPAPFAPAISSRRSRRKWWTSWAIAGVAVRPVPIAQTGS